MHHVGKLDISILINTLYGLDKSPHETKTSYYILRKQTILFPKAVPKSIYILGLNDVRYLERK